MAPTIGHGSWQQATTLAAAPAGCALRGSGGVGRRRARPPGRAPRLRRAAAAAGRGAARAVPPARHGRQPPGGAHDPARPGPRRLAVAAHPRQPAARRRHRHRRRPAWPPRPPGRAGRPRPDGGGPGGPGPRPGPADQHAQRRRPGADRVGLRRARHPAPSRPPTRRAARDLLGGALAVVAAARPPLAAKVAFVATFGAFYDLANLAGAVVTGATVYQGRTGPWHTAPGAGALVRASVLSLLAPAQASAVRAALAHAGTASGASAPAQLTPAGRAVVALLTNRDPARVARLAARLPASVQRVRKAFSPAFHVQGLRAPLLALHSTDDPAAPWTESALLVDAARAHDPGGARLTLVGVFSHVTQRRSLLAPGSLHDDWRLVRHVAGLLQTH